MTMMMRMVMRMVIRMISSRQHNRRLLQVDNSTYYYVVVVVGKYKKHDLINRHNNDQGWCWFLLFCLFSFHCFPHLICMKQFPVSVVAGRK